MDPLICLPDEEVRALCNERLLTVRDDAVFRLEGPGVTDCLQGLLTNNVKAGGEHGLVWGALLTPKGMILSDAWVRRDGEAAFVLVPAMAREQVRTLFQRSLPPRLAKVTDVTESTVVAWLLGPTVDAPAVGDLSRPHGPAPFAAMLLDKEQEQPVSRLVAEGWRLVPPMYADAAKLLMGWPTLGREIDEKTLVQEVRFDELEGVRYDKGCYTGQETVARLHFRGHPNRRLIGLRWSDGETPAATEVESGGKLVGSIATLGRLGEHTLALAVLRREVENEAIVEIGATRAVVTALPFATPESFAG